MFEEDDETLLAVRKSEGALMAEIAKKGLKTAELSKKEAKKRAKELKELAASTGLALAMNEIDQDLNKHKGEESEGEKVEDEKTERERGGGGGEEKDEQSPPKETEGKTDTLKMSDSNQELKEAMLRAMLQSHMDPSSNQALSEERIHELTMVNTDEELMVFLKGGSVTGLITQKLKEISQNYKEEMDGMRVILETKSQEIAAQNETMRKLKDIVTEASGLLAQMDHSGPFAAAVQKLLHCTEVVTKIGGPVTPLSRDVLRYLEMSKPQEVLACYGPGAITPASRFSLFQALRALAIKTKKEIDASLQ